MKYPDGIMLERGQYTVLLHGKNVDSFSYALEDKSDCGSEMCVGFDYCMYIITLYCRLGNIFRYIDGFILAVACGWRWNVCGSLQQRSDSIGLQYH